jgi:hypothetical protein
LIAGLEEYLERYRSLLLNGGPDPGTLFLSNHGHALSATRFGDLVSSITLRYGGKRFNPHLARDVFTAEWIRKHPGDVVTPSRNLWHRDTATLWFYAGAVDESAAAVQVEEWLDEQEARESEALGDQRRSAESRKPNTDSAPEDTVKSASAKRWTR